MKAAIMFFLSSLIALPILFFSGCKDNNDADPPKSHNLVLVKSYSTVIGEPSSVVFDVSGKYLWIVGGQKERVYQTNLVGDIIQTLAYKGVDPEGIVCDHRDSTLWVVEEYDRELVHLDTLGLELDRVQIPIEGNDNDGPEGAVFDDNYHLMILKEKLPSVAVEVDSAFKLIRQKEISFADDVSDITWNPKTKTFFIVSDQSRGVYEWTYDRGVINSYSLPANKYEGIAIDPISGLFYLVNNDLGTLDIFELQK